MINSKQDYTGSRGKLSAGKRKGLLLLHLLFSAIMLGVTVVFLHLSITAANSNDEAVIKACYSIMHQLASSAVQVSTIGTIITGVLLAILSQWGLLKYYWIITKEVLTLLVILLGPIGMYGWTLKAVKMTMDGTGATQNPVFYVNSSQLKIGIILQLISLVLLFVLSVIKPWGMRKQKDKIYN